MSDIPVVTTVSTTEESSADSTSSIDISSSVVEVCSSPCVLDGGNCICSQSGGNIHANETVILDNGYEGEQISIITNSIPITK